MTIGSGARRAGFAVAWGLTLLGLGSVAGCGTGGPEPSPSAGHEGQDGHEGHRHGAEAGAPAEAQSSVVMKRMTPSTDYPLDTCVVSGEPLTAMGDPVAFEVDGTEVQFCCDGCVKEFRKDPDTYLKKVRSARK